MATTVAAPSRGTNNSLSVGIVLAVVTFDIRFAAAIALLFNALMVVVAIIAIALTVPREDPGVGR